MPLPKPNDGESERDFISRCMGDPVIQEEFTDHDVQLGVCFGLWRDKNGGKAMELERKSFTGLELKKDKPGNFTARIATLNVIDKDGDVTLPGAFPEGKEILISAYQHGSWMGELPVGKAVIHERGNDVVVEGEFNLATATGKEHYETIKFAPQLQEWSYGFQVKQKEEDAEWEGHHVNRILKKLDVFEASPVLRGAGMGTAVLAIKSETKRAISYQSAHPDGTPKAPEDEPWDAAKEVADASVDDLKVMCAWVDSADKENKTAYKLPHHKASGQHSVVWKAVSSAMGALLGARGGVDIPDADQKGVYSHLKRHYAEFEKEPPEYRALDQGTSFAVQAEAALAAVNNLATRAKSLADLRRKEGRDLSPASREKLAAIDRAITETSSGIKSLLVVAPGDNPARTELLRSLRLLTEINIGGN